MTQSDPGQGLNIYIDSIHQAPQPTFGDDDPDETGDGDEVVTLDDLTK